MREGSLEAPTRHPIEWNKPDFYDPEKLDAELRRVFDICHGCRRCFNLCDSFPRLFDLIDESETEELDSVDSADFKPVIEACTLCDMCFLTKCPYVPPHEFNLDFPHLMLRARAIEYRKGERGFAETQLTKTDRNGRLAGAVEGLANWASKRGNTTTRPLLEKTADIHRDAELPKFHGRTFVKRAKAEAEPVNPDGPAAGHKAALYATCFANYNNPQIGMAARAVLAKNGVETQVVCPECCGMPQLEQGDIEAVADKAKRVAAELGPLIHQGHDIVALVPSCALMMKFEWPLIVPNDPAIKKLSEATFDISEYVIDLNRRHGLAEGMTALDGGVSVHIACHARAQNMGQKAAEMLKLLPETTVNVVERCSGHGGSWGIMKENFEVGMKIGRPVFRQMKKDDVRYIASECPLAGLHIAQGIEKAAKDDEAQPELVPHPIVLMARAYGMTV